MRTNSSRLPEVFSVSVVPHKPTKNIEKKEGGGEEKCCAVASIKLVGHDEHAFGSDHCLGKGS